MECFGGSNHASVGACSGVVMSRTLVCEFYDAEPRYPVAKRRRYEMSIRLPMAVSNSSPTYHGARGGRVEGAWRARGRPSSSHTDRRSVCVRSHRPRAGLVTGRVVRWRAAARRGTAAGNVATRPRRYVQVPGGERLKKELDPLAGIPRSGCSTVPECSAPEQTLRWSGWVLRRRSKTYPPQAPPLTKYMRIARWRSSFKSCNTVGIRKRADSTSCGPAARLGRARVDTGALFDLTRPRRGPGELPHDVNPRCFPICSI